MTDVLDLVCAVCVVGSRVAGAVYIGVAAKV